MGIIQVKNKRTGVISPMRVSQWEVLQKDPKWQGVFVALPVQEPEEVTKLKERKEAEEEATNETTGN